MQNFIYWKNLNLEHSNISQVKDIFYKHPNFKKLHHHEINDSSGIIYSSNNDQTLTTENEHAIFFSPQTNIHYKNNKGEMARKNALHDFIGQGELDATLFSNNFSYLVIDKVSGNASFAIDKFGIETLYYMASEKSIIVSSSIDAIAAVSEKPLGVSSQAIYNYIDSHVIPSPLTIYENVFKVEPSQIISVKDFQLNKSIYWLPTFNETAPKDIEQLKEDTRQALNQAIINCDITETTGAFLSGGLDSSTVSGYFAKNSERKVSTYTMGFDQAGYDETEYALIASNHFGTNLRSYYVTPDDVAEAFSEVIKSYDEPFGNSSAIPSYLCAKFAHKDGVTSMLAGDGGDEIFAGNERYAKQHVFEFYEKIPTPIRTKLLEPLLLNDSAYTKYQPFAKAKSYIEQAITPMPNRMERYNFINHFGAANIFQADFLSKIDQTVPIQQKHEAYQRPENASMLNRMLYMDWKFTLADNDLVKVGNACRLAGIEVFYPMLDDHLVELSTKIPSMVKMKNGRELRSFYKETMNNFLPKEIIHKKKQGFGLPFGEWLKKSPKLQAQIYDNLTALKKRNFIQPAYIDNIIDIHRTQAAASYFGTMVWVLAVLEEWLSSRNL